MKRGSHIAKSGKEDNLFDFAFEIELNEHYEDNYLFRDIEKAVKKAKERKEFRKMLNIKYCGRKKYKSPALSRRSEQEISRYLDDTENKSNSKLNQEAQMSILNHSFACKTNRSQLKKMIASVPAKKPRDDLFKTVKASKGSKLLLDDTNINDVNEHFFMMSQKGDIAPKSILDSDFDKQSFN